jgi:hypothetical protein
LLFESDLRGHDGSPLFSKNEKDPARPEGRERVLLDSKLATASGAANHGLDFHRVSGCGG